jgi:hypothetical protein
LPLRQCVVGGQALLQAVRARPPASDAAAWLLAKREAEVAAAFMQLEQCGPAAACIHGCIGHPRRALPPRVCRLECCHGERLSDPQSVLAGALNATVEEARARVAAAVRAIPGRLTPLNVSHSTIVFVWVRRALRKY